VRRGQARDAPGDERAPDRDGPRGRGSDGEGGRGGDRRAVRVEAGVAVKGGRVGPNVTLEEGSKVADRDTEHSVIGPHAVLERSKVRHSIVGGHAAHHLVVGHLPGDRPLGRRGRLTAAGSRVRVPLNCARPCPEERVGRVRVGL
jgi:hypothetical protein